MFWKFGFHTPSAIEGILEKDDFTLEELLDDEDVLQECRNQNNKLVTFLSQEESVKKLLAYVTNEPEGSPDDRLRFKYPNVASELLTTDSPGILDVICTTESLDLIWGVLDQPAPLNPLIASYFTKLIMMLLNKRPELITGYMYGKQIVFNKLISHLGTSAIMDVIRRMTTVDSGHGGFPLMQWLSGDKQLIAILVGLFEVSASGADAMILTNAATLMNDLVIDGRKEAIELQEFASPSPFLNQLESEMHLSLLLKHVLQSGNRVALDKGLPVILTLLDEHVRGEDEAPPSDMDLARHQDEVKCIMKSLVPCVADVHTLLTTPIPTPENGRKMLGAVRLNAARVIEAMLKAAYSDVEEEILTSGALPTLIQLFEEFTENNFLHKYVGDCVRHIISNFSEDASKPSLFKHLFTDCKLLSSIIRMYNASMEEEKKAKGRRFGYTGHLTKMANLVCQAIGSEAANPIALYFPEVEGSEEPHISVLWAEFKQVHLDVQNDRWQVHLGGQRPRITMDSDEDDEDDESLYPAEDSANADLAFSRFLHQRVTLALGDEDGDFDSDEDSDDDVPTAAELSEDANGTLFTQFGKTGSMAEFVDPVPVNTGTVQGETTEWQLAQDKAAEDGAAEATEDAEPLPPGPVPPLSLGGEEGAAVEPRLSAEAAEPEATSTPVDGAAPNADWATFDNAPATAAETAPADGEAAATEAAEATPTVADEAEDAAPTVPDADKEAPAAAETAEGANSPSKAAPTVDIEGGGGLFNSSA